MKIRPKNLLPVLLIAVLPAGSLLCNELGSAAEDKESFLFERGPSEQQHRVIMLTFETPLHHRFSLLKQLSMKSPVQFVAFKPDGKALLIFLKNGKARLFDLETEKQQKFKKKTFDSDDLKEQEASSLHLHGVSFTTEGKPIVIGSEKHTIYLWDLETGKKLKEFSLSVQGIRDVAFNHDYTTAVIVAEDQKAYVWYSTLEKEVYPLGEGKATQIAVSSEGNKAFIAGTDGIGTLWDVETDKRVQVLKKPLGALALGAFSPDGKILLTTVPNNTVYIWDVETGEEIAYFTGFADSVNSVVFSPDGALIATVAHKNIFLWKRSTETGT